MEDDMWPQVIAVVRSGVPVEKVAECLGVSTFEISQWNKVISETEDCIRIKTYPKIIPIHEVQANWLTAGELKFLGVNLMGRGVRPVGRTVLPCERSVERRGGDLIVVSSKKHILYPIPVCMLKRLWELRPSPSEIHVTASDSEFIEMLQRKIAAFELGGPHWTQVNLSAYKPDLKLQHEENKAERRNAVVHEIIDNKEI